jgi:hypothetical protein
MQHLNKPASPQHRDCISESDSYSDDCGGSETDDSQFSEESVRRGPCRPPGGYQKNETSVGVKPTNGRAIDFILKNKQIFDTRNFRLGASSSPTKPRTTQEQPLPFPPQIPLSAVLSPQSYPPQNPKHHPPPNRDTDPPSSQPKPQPHPILDDPPLKPPKMNPYNHQPQKDPTNPDLLIINNNYYTKDRTYIHDIWPDDEVRPDQNIYGATQEGFFGHKIAISSQGNNAFNNGNGNYPHKLLLGTEGLGKSALGFRGGGGKGSGRPVIAEGGRKVIGGT